MCTHTHIYLFVCICIYIHTCVYIQIHTYTHIYTCVYFVFVNVVPCGNRIWFLVIMQFILLQQKLLLPYYWLRQISFTDRLQLRLVLHPFTFDHCCFSEITYLTGDGTFSDLLLMMKLCTLWWTLFANVNFICGQINMFPF